METFHFTIQLLRKFETYSFLSFVQANQLFE